MTENCIERNKRLNTEKKIADFKVKQKLDYDFKIKYAEARAWEFYNHPDVAGNCYVAVGGLDSITLLMFLRKIGINVPAVSVWTESSQMLFSRMKPEPWTRIR